MTPADLRRAGETLYGSRWQTELARALGMEHGARVREWIAGKRSIPPRIAGEIAELLRRAGTQCTVEARRFETMARESA